MTAPSIVKMGIEQEIRNFLEQKAQVNKLPPCSTVTQEAQSESEPEKVKAKQVATQKKPSRMSVTQRRKFKEENSSDPNMSGIDKNITVTAPISLPDHRKRFEPIDVFQQKSDSPNSWIT